MKSGHLINLPVGLFTLTKKLLQLHFMQSAISDISEEVENLRKKAESTELASQDWIDSVITVIDNSIILDRLEKKASSVSDSLRGKCKFVCRSHLCNKMSQ